MSSSVNRVFLLGNLTRDPEITYTPKGTAIAAFGMAMNRQWTNDKGEKLEEVTFCDITFFGRLAEVIGEYVKKGHKLHVEGRLQLDQWDDKQTGKKRQALRIIGENMTLLNNEKRATSEDRSDHSRKAPPPRGDVDEPETAPTTHTPPPRTTPPPARRPPADPDLDAAEDDIPF